MTNEFGERLDENGYAPSIMVVYPSDCCFNCDAIGDLCRHEIFNGSNRQKSKAYGLWVNLCPQCHMKIHDHPDEARKLKKQGQEQAMDWYEWTVEDFRERFGKSYV